MRGHKEASVTLGFSKFEVHLPEARVFDILVEGEAVYPLVDVYALAGHDSAWRTTPIDVVSDDDTLEIRLNAVRGQPILSSILVTTIGTTQESAASLDYWVLIILGLLSHIRRRPRYLPRYLCGFRHA